jgi:hypothetical protein
MKPSPRIGADMSTSTPGETKVPRFARDDNCFMKIPPFHKCRFIKYGFMKYRFTNTASQIPTRLVALNYEADSVVVEQREG